MDWLASVLGSKDDNTITTIVKASSIKGRFDKRSLSDIMKKAFTDYDAIVFMSAVGIAVRAIAPYIKSKATDPAVIVMDEKMQFCISLLSGHLGGANELTTKLSTMSGATPIITTATDIEDKFSVDEFARRNSLAISDLNLVKEISTSFLEGRKVGFLSDVSLKNFKGVPQIEKEGELGILITNRANRKVFKKQLTLYPKNLYVGIGMKKGTREADIRKFVEEIFDKEGLSTASIKCLATIDIKKDEAGLKKYAAKKKLKIKTYSAKQLRSLGGEFESSGFVKAVTGVDNVCERAAMMAVKNNGKLIVKKVKGNGITLAVAQRRK